jgi:DNA-directed RNA polymerase subunit M/transcription elongation factor TFIIS
MNIYKTNLLKYITMSDINLVCKNPDNVKIVEKYLKIYEDPTDALYELGFLTKVENISLKDAIAMLKSKKIGKNHPKFDEASTKLTETDHFMDTPFEVQEGSVACGKCKSTRTISYARAERMDEGLRVYTFCVDCKFRYSERA